MAARGHILPCRASDGTPYYRLRLDLGRDPATGARRQPYQPGRYPSERAAARALTLLLARLERTPAPDPRRRTVADLLAEWLDADARLSVRPKTLRSYESCCRVQLVPALGALRIDQLTAGRVERYRTERMAAGVSTRMIDLAVLHLHQACAYAVRHGYLSHNPADNLKPLRHPHREMAVWDAAQARAFLAVAAGHAYAPLWHLALQTGMRKGELLGLRWSDVDAERARLVVRRSLSAGEAGDTKSGRARSIDLDAATVTLLRAHRAAQGRVQMRLGPAWRDEGLVIATAMGTPIQPDNVNRAMDLLIARAGVPRIRFHDLRHTCATLLLTAGRPVHLVARLLGHASPATTLRVYAHVLDGQGEETAVLMGRLLGSG